jgi:SAM-dependent methyltransferase
MYHGTKEGCEVEGAKDSPGSGRYEELQQRLSYDGDRADDWWGTAIPPTGSEEFSAVEEGFGRCLDESLAPRGRESLYGLVESVKLAPGGVAVDVGCGSGRDAVELARRFGLSVHGVDPRSANLDRARDLALAADLDQAVELHLGKAEALPLPSKSCDLVWCKEVISFTDLDLAIGEFGRVLRPDGVGILYQVLIGPAMSDEEAAWFVRGSDFGPCRALRPKEVESAFARAGLAVRERVDYASEWGEAAQERDGGAGRRLIHVARLLRQPERYVERFGETSYRIMLGDCLWHVYRMIGKLWGVAFVFAHR